MFHYTLSCDHQQRKMILNEKKSFSGTHSACWGLSQLLFFKSRQHSRLVTMCVCTCDLFCFSTLSGGGDTKESEDNAQKSNDSNGNKGMCVCTGA